MRPIFVDYPDGAGGEYLSKIISQHHGFYKPITVTTADGRESPKDFTGLLGEYRSGRSQQQWIDDFPTVLDRIEFLTSDITEKICIPYTACTLLPANHLRIIKDRYPESKIISIKISDSIKHYVLAEVFRKVLLIELSDSDRKKYYDIFGVEPQYWADVAVLFDGHDLSATSRRDFIQRLFDTYSNLNYDFEISDCIINWQDFYLSSDTAALTNTYQKLVDTFNLNFDKDILGSVVRRNHQNAKNLLSYDLLANINRYVGL